MPSSDPIEAAGTPTPIAPTARSIVPDVAPVSDTDVVREFVGAGGGGSRNAVRRTGLEASVYYPGCNQARAAGVAPIYRNEPGYREEMGGDGDRIACEPIRN